MDLSRKNCGVFLGVLLAASLFCRPVSAQNEAVLSRYNEAIDNIVKEIIEVKGGYPELESFSKAAVNAGPDGYKNIFYIHNASGGASGSEDPYGYRFSIALRNLDNQEAQQAGSAWDVKFPLLGVKVVVDSQRKGEWASFDLHKIVENNLDSLRILEQDFLPFRLEIKTDKEVYSVGEEITLTVSLKNMGPKPYKVADLDENALYCSIGDMEWGTPNAQAELSRVLSGRGMIQKMLRINGPETPQEISIACTYVLGYKGVQPYSRIKVAVQPKR